MNHNQESIRWAVISLEHTAYYIMHAIQAFSQVWNLYKFTVGIGTMKVTEGH